MIYSRALLFVIIAPPRLTLQRQLIGFEGGVLAARALDELIAAPDRVLLAGGEAAN